MASIATVAPQPGASKLGIAAQQSPLSVAPLSVSTTDISYGSYYGATTGDDTPEPPRALLSLSHSTAWHHVLDHVQRGVSTLIVLSSFHTPSSSAHLIVYTTGRVTCCLCSSNRFVLHLPVGVNGIPCAYPHCSLPELYNHFLYITVCLRGCVVAIRVGA